MYLFKALVELAIHAISSNLFYANRSKCRNQPGNPTFPTQHQFDVLNASIDGRLLRVVPSGQFCRVRAEGCSDTEWQDSVFRSNIPGAMLQVNWEQDYISNPPSLCFRNSSTCGQGSVPIYAVNATTAGHIQAGVRFAQAYNLKVAIKASGHDYLGRSTAKNSLLLWTRYLEEIIFHDSFEVGGKSQGSAVTVGSGVGLHTLYQATKTQSKIYVGGTAANVVPAGGYIQGAGHSALSPLYGLASDNALEFQVVIANGSLVTVNAVSNPDLFWALRGGGAGSWGVIISATLRTFPMFNLVFHLTLIETNSSASIAELATLHAQHIFDWDALNMGQYFFVNGSTSKSSFSWYMASYFPDASIKDVNNSLAPFLDAATARGFQVSVLIDSQVNANDALSPSASDPGGADIVLGSRLVPADVYRQNATAVGKAYKDLFDAGIPAPPRRWREAIFCSLHDVINRMLFVTGQVAKNAGIKSAINPRWRTAKTHVVILDAWSDSTSPDEVEKIREHFTGRYMPILDALAGSGSGSYSNEADVREPHFQTTFFGTNYARLSAIKKAYDPRGLFIVGAGVGSEEWDAEGLCRI